MTQGGREITFVGKYLALKIRETRDCGSERNFQPCLPNIARLKAERSLNDFVYFDFPFMCSVFFISRLSAMFIWFRLKISFDQVQIQSISFASSTLHIQKHKYFGGLNNVIFVAYILCRFMFFTWILWNCSQIHFFFLNKSKWNILLKGG